MTLTLLCLLALLQIIDYWATFRTMYHINRWQAFWHHIQLLPGKLFAALLAWVALLVTAIAIPEVILPAIVLLLELYGAAIFRWRQYFLALPKHSHA